MKRSVYVRRLAAMGLLLVLLLTGCAGLGEARYGYTMPEGSGFDASGLILGIDMEQGSFYSLPVLDMLRKVLPEDMPLFVALYDQDGRLQVWDRETLDAEDNYSDRFNAAGQSKAAPAALARGILAQRERMDAGDNPLVVILTQRDEDLSDQYDAAAEVGMQLRLCRMGETETNQQGAASTVRALRQIGELLSLQVVALTANGRDAAFTLPDLGIERMAFLVQGGFDSLTYKDNDITGEQDAHYFAYTDESRLSVIGYQTDQPGKGGYVLSSTDEDAAVWLCLRHTMDVQWQLWPETGAHVVAGQPMYLELRLTRDGKAYALPKGLTARCSLTVDDAETSLSLTAKKDRFYQLRGRKLVSGSFTVEPLEQYAVTLTMDYPDFGTLTFQHNRGYGLTMRNFEPYLCAGDSLCWALGAQQVFTPADLFADPEGGSVTLHSAEGTGKIQASLTESGNLYLKADNPLYASGSVTLVAYDEDLGISRQTVQARYMLLPWWALYAIVGGLCALGFAVWLCAEAGTFWGGLGFFVLALLCGAVWPISLPIRVIGLLSSSSRARRKQRREDKRKQKAERWRAQENARKEREEEQRKRQQAAESQRLRELKQQVQDEKAALQAIEEQLRTEVNRLKQELSVAGWLKAADRKPCVGVFLQAHPEIMQALEQYPDELASDVMAEMEAWADKIGQCLKLHYSTSSAGSLDETLQKLCRFKRTLPDGVQLSGKKIRLDDSVKALYEKSHAEPAGAAPPVIVKVMAAGSTKLQYLGYFGADREDGLCDLGSIQMNGSQKEPPISLADIVKRAQGVYLLPFVQDGRQGYEVVSDSTDFYDRHDIRQKAQTFLRPDREYQLRSTAVVVEIKPPIE